MKTGSTVVGTQIGVLEMPLDAHLLGLQIRPDGRYDLLFSYDPEQGKLTGLGQMVKLGCDVPKGFTIVLCTENMFLAVNETGQCCPIVEGQVTLPSPCHIYGRDSHGVYCQAGEFSRMLDYRVVETEGDGEISVGGDVWLSLERKQRLVRTPIKLNGITELPWDIDDIQIIGGVVAEHLETVGDSKQKWFFKLVKHGEFFEEDYRLFWADREDVLVGRYVHSD
jgi:hypothetical protein